MAELISRERLQPSLLDRLTDDDIQQVHESRDKRVLSISNLRKAVLRDLNWLLNSNCLGPLPMSPACPLAEQSALNYGMPNLSGTTSSSVDRVELGRQICQAIWDFEPRILRDTVQVIPAQRQGDGPNQIVFEIHGELWGQILPDQLYLKTELDLEAGDVKVSDIGARGPR